MIVAAFPSPRLVLSFRLALFYAAVFLVVGVLMPFWPLWLNETRGMSAEEIGLLLGAGLWMKVLANPFFAHFADRRPEKRRLLATLALGALAGFSLFHWAQGFWQLLGVTLITFSMFTALMPLGENLTMITSYAHKLDYGRIRLWGSLTFVLASAGGGMVLVELPVTAVLWLVLGGVALTFFAALQLPDPETTGIGGESQAPEAPLRRILREPLFLIFLAAAGLIQASHSAYYGFATLFWREAGFADDVIGGLWATGVMAEVLLFAFSGAIMARVTPTTLLVIAAAAGVLRWCVIGATTNPFVLFPIQTLHALTFGATHLAAMHFIARATPPGCSATAQGLYSSTAMGGLLGLGVIL
ncbi:MAG: MFS transporter, partial [Alphaproteobacteria bacterium]|nr:MFS transporter [Alphaproteobacteria bacterium]